MEEVTLEYIKVDMLGIDDAETLYHELDNIVNKYEGIDVSYHIQDIDTDSNEFSGYFKVKAPDSVHPVYMVFEYGE